jgi:hypothetical protein
VAWRGRYASLDVHTLRRRAGLGREDYRTRAECVRLLLKLEGVGEGGSSDSGGSDDDGEWASRLKLDFSDEEALKLSPAGSGSGS